MLDFLTDSLLAWKKRRREAKHQKLVYDMIRELHSLTVTVHGRMLLGNVIKDMDNGLEPEIRRMFYVLVHNAPLDEWSVWN